MTDSEANGEGLEAQMKALEYRMSLEEGLRASQDRDLADLKLGQSAANHLLQALSITQSEHTKKFAEILQKLGVHDTKLDQCGARLDQYGVRLDQYGVTLDQYGARLDQFGVRLDQYGVRLDRHEAILDQHTAILDQHTAILDRHTATLDQHTAILDAHSEKLDRLDQGQTRIFETLHVILNRLDDLSPASH